MYVTLLLLAPAVCEWVEISQQNYRKPARTHHYHTIDKSNDAGSSEVNSQHQIRKPPRTHNSPFTDIATEIYEEDSTIQYRKPVRTQYFPTEIVTQLSTEVVSDLSVYKGNSIRPHQIAPIDRVTEEYTGASTSEKSHHYHKPIRKHFFEIDTVTEDSDNFHNKNKVYLNQSIVETNIRNKGNINKVSKLGNVQRVQPHTNVVKAPNLRLNQAETSINFIKSKAKNETVKGTSVDEGLIVNSKEKLHGGTLPNDFGRQKLNSTVNDNQWRKELNRKRIDHLSLEKTTEDKIHKLIDKPINNMTLGTRFAFNKNPSTGFITKGDNIMDSDIYEIKNFESNSRLPNILSTSTTFSDIEKETTVKHERDQPFTKRNELKIFPDTKTKAETPDPADYATVNDDEEEHSQQTFPDQDVNSDKSQQSHANNEPSSDSKSKSVENLLTLMKVVAETIKKNTRNSVNSKTVYLENLKDTILKSIKERIDAAWPDDAPETQVRTRGTRAVQATKRGHLEIPSSESALMTISFLTFAVFLIKLVLQVIQTYKNKTMMVTPAVVATVGRVAAPQRRSQP